MRNLQRSYFSDNRCCRVRANAVRLYPSIPNNENLNILKNSTNSIPIKNHLQKIQVQWLTLFLRTTCRVTFADTFCSKAVPAILNLISVPQLAENFPVLVHTLMYTLTKFQLYAILFGIGLLCFSKTTGLLFQFDSTLYKKMSGVAIGTKFVPTYACIFMDYVETEFLKTQDI